MTDKNGRRKKHLAEVLSDMDESARRKLIHVIFAEGGKVHEIMDTDDKSRYPGEAPKRVFE